MMYWMRVVCAVGRMLARGKQANICVESDYIQHISLKEGEIRSSCPQLIKFALLECGPRLIIVLHSLNFIVLTLINLGCLLVLSQVTTLGECVMNFGELLFNS